MRVKICGTATFADLDCAVAAGADAVGFLMGITHVTQDAVTPETAAAMVATLPPFIVPVAVTHLTKPSDLIRIVELSRCTTLQIQDMVTPDDIAEVREALPYLRIMKAVHVMDESAITTAKYFSDTADAILLDTRTADRIGGTGITHDWNISAKIVKECSCPVILAGGLTPENVTEAITRVRPYAVDVHTGVKKNGVRDAERTRAFVANARTARD
ncbi:MAG TPA: phosphoribosylanthranilate isomerase [Methanocorpusculum sp.]|nr:phosphoribosylanthranilate isomerase [Methanocorpusculum sp.]HJK58796.1 phosphoribosylanthranilate isomerase [Methanocorpusculum sp.]HJK70408.1 phosphoribosylanthranilate isomerase [Methanocorpusculum sp.]HJK72502.1 phosphoribosylanthranilate isomerase [Methanocorpusculum sp.]HJK74957.1 phosphoribosylanthranilate isomerase [Methanocorpusculum sp.]